MDRLFLEYNLVIMGLLILLSIMITKQLKLLSRFYGGMPKWFLTKIIATLMLITTEELDTRANTRPLEKESNVHIFTSKRIFITLFFEGFKRKAD